MPEYLGSFVRVSETSVRGIFQHAFKTHPGCFKDGFNFLPRGMKKLVQRTNLNARRLHVLGNACAPPQAALALRLLKQRFQESQQYNLINRNIKEGIHPEWKPFSTLNATKTVNRQPVSTMSTTPSIKSKDARTQAEPIRHEDEMGMSEEDYLLLTHIIQLSALLDRILFAGLRAQTKKTRVLAREIKILGHLLSDQGLRPCPDKVKAISQMPSPTSQSQVRRALGAFSWFLGAFS